MNMINKVLITDLFSVANNLTGLPVCDLSRPMSDIPGYSPYSKTGLFRDTVMTFAQSLQYQLDDACAEVFNMTSQTEKRQRLENCVTENDLLEYIQNATFNGSYGVVK